MQAGVITVVQDDLSYPTKATYLVAASTCTSAGRALYGQGSPGRRRSVILVTDRHLDLPCWREEKHKADGSDPNAAETGDLH